LKERRSSSAGSGRSRSDLRSWRLSELILPERGQAKEPSVLLSPLIIGRNRYEVAGMSGKIANFEGNNALWANQRRE
jgi:hypothetical protein